jgi:hypothetical protein
MNRRRPRDLPSLLLLVVLFSVLACPGRAIAVMPTELSAEGWREPAPPRGEAVYRLRFAAGSEGAAFGFEYRLPDWPTQEAVFGSPFQIISAQLLGPGTFEPAKDFPVPLPVLRRQEGCRRERTTPLGSKFWVEVPPNSHSSIEFRARGTYPAWSGTPYSIDFSSFSVNEPTAPRIPLAMVITPALSLKGTHIQIKVVEDPPDGKRVSPELVGRTLPPLRSGRIALRAVRPAAGGSVRLVDWADSRPPAASLGSVLTDRQGRASRPLHAGGRYAVLARSEARGKRVADWNCGAFFRVD